MSFYVGLPLVLLTALLEAAVLPLFRVSGLQPNLMLVLLTAWLMVRGPREAFVLIPAGGLFLGLVDGAPMGTALVALAPIAILHDLRGAHLTEGGLLITTAFTIVMTVVYHLVYLAVFVLHGAPAEPISALLSTILPACLLNAVALVPIYVLLVASSQGLRRAEYRTSF